LLLAFRKKLRAEFLLHHGLSSIGRFLSHGFGGLLFQIAETLYCLRALGLG
jgi:hypothetical protein